ncbi:substrate-binding domain-containing protein [Micromonospora sp. NPDC000668]|uniref:substrate-binding domain-containing protein n=1 Tax=Micromonospora sp. NPDC000668 TaxID=3364219 RepID=UPI0036C91407
MSSRARGAARRTTRDRLRTFVDQRPSVSAIAAFDDDVALRTLTAFGDLGLSAPDDVALIGFDDTEYGALWTPALTTVHIDAVGYGRRAARSVLGLDTGDLPPDPSSIIERDSA